MQLVPEPAKDSAILAAALQFASAGISVVPASMKGTKAPITSWKRYQEERASYEQILQWFSNGETGLGVVTGAVSGNLEMIELEGRAVQSGMMEEAREIAINSGLGEVWNTLNGYVELTPSGGLHWLYRLEEGAIVPGNTKIARRPGIDGKVDVLCETRGEGGFVVVAPSSGPVHPSGNPWVMISGGPATIPTISREDRDAIHLVFRALDSMPSIEQVREAVTSVKADVLTPGDDFNARGNWSEILNDWTKLHTSRGVTYWRRPGKDIGISATTGRNDGDNLYVFTTSTIFDAEKPYSKFAALTAMQHGGDFKACARELRRGGYGAVALALPLTPVPALTSAQLEILRADRADRLITGEDVVYIESVAEIVERTSWWPKPLDIYDTEVEPEPEFLARDDKSKLFYRGKVNGIMGESESGKTWIALHAVQQALCVGQKVIYLDFEDSARGIMNRLRALGTMNEHLVNLTYAQPDEQMTVEARADLYEALAQLKPDLVVVDGVNAAMTLLGLDLISNTDATKFSQTILRPLTTSGAAVITIDHVTKSKDNQGSFAIGAQAKRADVNGALIKCELEAPFGRGLHGVLKLIVAKDRPGYVRAIAAGGKYLGSAHLQSYGDGRVRISIIPEINEFDSFRPTHVMEVVSTYLASLGPGAFGQTQIETGAKGKGVTIRAALKVLAAEGFIKMENGARGSLNFIHVLPYLELSDHTTEKSKMAQMDASLLKAAQ